MPTSPPPSASSPPAADPIIGRRVALSVLDAVLRREQPLDDTLARDAGFAALDPRDRAFVRLLLATTLRRLGEIDATLASRLETPLPPKAAATLDTLRLGVAQLLFLATPAHASVDTSVRLVESIGQRHLKGLVNAVLRRVARDRDGASPDGADGADPARLNTPSWLWESWVAAYGEATTRAIAAAHLHEAPLDLSVKGGAETWATLLEAELLPTGTLRRAAGGRIEDLPGFADGAWWVQDAAAALPVRLLGDVAGRSVLDLCAAPGGKTMQLCAAGARVTAVDLSPRRLTRVGENLKRVGLTAELIAADATRWRPTAAPDAILLDAPCTATGTLRRHPDIAWLKDREDVARLSLAQDRLLAAAVGMLPAGGTLVYAVCSLQPEEGPARIEAALARLPVTRIPVRPEELPGLETAITAAGDLRTLPCHWPERGGLDGFYAARLRIK
ncbi:MAG: MFS transporter [Rhodospirillales bacterium]|nr:MAG: MFS transporter [Rhodospirillales bacterium]